MKSIVKGSLVKYQVSNLNMSNLPESWSWHVSSLLSLIKSEELSLDIELSQSEQW